MYLCVHLYIHIYVHIYVHIYIYIYTYSHPPRSSTATATRRSTGQRWPWPPTLTERPHPPISGLKCALTDLRICRVVLLRPSCDASVTLLRRLILLWPFYDPQVKGHTKVVKFPALVLVWSFSDPSAILLRLFYHLSVTLLRSFSDPSIVFLWPFDDPQVKGHTKVVKFLVEKKFPVGTKNKDGDTPL